ncbi:MAG TPA: PilZ domain-containing protein [Thermoanaerobaculia bacterium]|nr:PilZ domain-containing protein [Thermoanaerobaculia bacterium]
MVADDRRKFQRLKLSKPILATFGDGNALVLDVGVNGAFVEHYGTVEPGQRLRLSFRWRAEDVAFDSEVARTTVVRTPAGDGKSAVSHTGVRFVDGIEGADDRLQDMIATFIGKILAAQRANANGDISDTSGAATLAEIGEARRLRSRGFVAYRLKGTSWWRVPTTSSKQPADGFTVAAFEDDEEVETLCRAYEKADEEGRRLIRMVAELSALSVSPGRPGS